jgi:transcriptional regulator with XRE-family HTH domain
MESKILKKTTPNMGRQEFLATTKSPFHFIDSGLDNVYLVGIKYFIDTEGNKIAEIPAIKQLMQLIARDIVMSPRDLNGKEIKFLRKRLGKKATEYCTYLGVTHETLSRIENEHQPVGAQLQKLARLAYCIFSEDPALAQCAKAILESIADEIKSLKTSKRKKIVLEMGRNHEWKERMAA